MKLVERLRALNRAEAAKQIGVSAAMVSYVLCGRRTPSIRIARPLAAHLGVTSDELFDALDQIKRDAAAAKRKNPKRRAA